MRAYRPLALGPDGFPSSRPVPQAFDVDVNSGAISGEGGEELIHNEREDQS